MKREIKFRAWDAINSEMIYPKSNILGTSISNGFIINRYETIMQFTGLYDKNRKEIYEGDVMQFPDGRISSVIWHNYMWAIQSDPFSKTEKKFCNMDNDDGISKIIHHADRYANLKKGQIIGNIHQNPELLQP